MAGSDDGRGLGEPLDDSQCLERTVRLHFRESPTQVGWLRLLLLVFVSFVFVLSSSLALVCDLAFHRTNSLSQVPSEETVLLHFQHPISFFAATYGYRFSALAAVLS